MTSHFDSAVNEESSESRWYALHVRCNQEWAVQEGLSCREISHFLPSYESVRQWKDRRVKLQLPLFPGYLFVRIPLRERLTVVTVPNVVSIVGQGNSPTPIPQEQIEWIQRGVAHGNAIPHEWLEVGQRVMIMQGALAGLEGILVSRRNSNRVVIALGSIAQSFAVVVDVQELQALPSERKPHSASNIPTIPAEQGHRRPRDGCPTRPLA
jgi:transcription antitermination factor NusG